MRRVALLATVLVTLLAVAGCGSDDETPGGSEGSDAPTRIELSFEGGEAPPVERVDVGTGEEIELVITADEPGELHVHSHPEQVVAYGAGTTTEKITIEQPGVVDVESHDLGVLVLQLQVD